MSQIDAALTRLKAAAFQLGTPELASRAGLDERTVRRLLKEPPVQIANLKKLEKVADEIGIPTAAA